MTPNRRSTVQEPPRHRKASSPAWPAFGSKLAEALAVLEEDQFLVISEKRGWAYVQFAGQGSFGVRAECVSNNYLDEAHVLRAGQMTALRRIGWSAPTGTPTEASPKRQPEGSPNAPPPETPSANTIEGLRDLVVKAVRKASGNADLEFTEDGDLPLRFGSAAVRVRVLDDPPCLRVFSAILENVEVDDRLVNRVHALNSEARFARFFVLDGIVFAATEMFTSPFVAEHVASACLQLGSLADEYGQVLQKEFGGRRGFEEASEGLEVQ